MFFKRPYLHCLIYLFIYLSSYLSISVYLCVFLLLSDSFPQPRTPLPEPLLFPCCFLRLYLPYCHPCLIFIFIISNYVTRVSSPPSLKRITISVKVSHIFVGLTSYYYSPAVTTFSVTKRSLFRSLSPLLLNSPVFCSLARALQSLTS